MKKLFWIKLLSNKIKMKDTQAAMDVGVGMNASLGHFK